MRNLLLVALLIGVFLAGAVSAFIFNGVVAMGQTDASITFDSERKATLQQRNFDAIEISSVSDDGSFTLSKTSNNETILAMTLRIDAQNNMTNMTSQDIQVARDLKIKEYLNRLADTYESRAQLKPERLGGGIVTIR